MTSLFNSLTEISTGYSVFEKDQVLTEAQLNSVSEYLDDQDRLSRINLTGVGIICGLNVSRSGSSVRLGKGVGITTDGDLLRIAADTSYTRFKAYDTNFPKYPPLYVDAESMLPAYELLESGSADPLSQGLGQFNGSTGLVLGDMVALLLVESYIKDHDLCTGADCDNHSKDYVSKARLILVEKTSVSALMPAIQTADAAARALDHLVAEHVAVSNTITTPAQLATRYRNACNSMRGRLVNAMPKLWSEASFLLTDSFNTNPTSAWVTRLNSINNSFASSSSRIQYYFDFLKDLIDTWNEMRDLLFGENAWCCPDIGGFAKHLMLGNLTPGADPHENRHGFYPASAINRDGRVAEARFLAEKIDRMLASFALPAVQNSAAAIRVTPSCTAKQRLQQRAIPYYYPHVASRPMTDRWNYRLAERGMQRHSYGYHAASYAAEGAAANPLGSAFDGNDFFRIEGHQGQAATGVLTALENLIADHNLPFSVYGLALGNQVNNVVNRRGAGYTDLNRMHYMLRQDVVRKLDDVKSFSSSYTSKIGSAISSNQINDSTQWTPSVLSETVGQHNNTIMARSDNAIAGLNQGYASYRQSSSWMTDVGLAMSEAGQYKGSLDKITTTSYNSVFDSWIDYDIVNWLPWLDDIIVDKDEKADSKKLFGKFLDEHPGLEHTGGVNRGGTFIVVYDNSGTVIADFMLSHYFKEIVEEEEPEPPLTKPNFPKGNVLIDSIRIHDDWDNQLDVRFGGIETQIVDNQSFYQNLFTDLVNISPGTITPTPGPIDEFPGGFEQPGGGLPGGGGGFPGGGGGFPGGGGGFPGGGGGYPGGGGFPGVDPGLILPGQAYDDVTLGAVTDRLIQQAERVDMLNGLLENESLPAERRAGYEAELGIAEEGLARDIEAVATQMDRAGTSVAAGTEGRTSMRAMDVGMKALENNTTALNNSRNSLESVAGGTSNSELAGELGLMLGGSWTP